MDFDPAVFLKLGQLLCSNEYIYYNCLIFKEDIDRYNKDNDDKEDQETKNKFKKIIIEGISKYNEKNNKLKRLKNELEILNNEIIEIKLIKDREINSFVLDKYKIYEETIRNLIILKDEIEQQIREL